MGRTRCTTPRAVPKITLRRPRTRRAYGVPRSDRPAPGENRRRYEFRPLRRSPQTARTYDSLPVTASRTAPATRRVSNADAAEISSCARPTTVDLVGGSDTPEPASPGFDSSCLPAMAQGETPRIYAAAWGKYVTEKIGAHHTDDVVPLVGPQAAVYVSRADAGCWRCFFPSRQVTTMLRFSESPCFVAQPFRSCSFPAWPFGSPRGLPLNRRGPPACLERRRRRQKQGTKQE